MEALQHVRLQLQEGPVEHGRAYLVEAAGDEAVVTDLAERQVAQYLDEQLGRQLHEDDGARLLLLLQLLRPIHRHGRPLGERGLRLPDTAAGQGAAAAAVRRGTRRRDCDGDLVFADGKRRGQNESPRCRCRGPSAVGPKIPNFSLELLPWTF